MLNYDRPNPSLVSSGFSNLITKRLQLANGRHVVQNRVLFSCAQKASKYKFPWVAKRITNPLLKHESLLYSLHK